jgi:hypothetical protein
MPAPPGKDAGPKVALWAIEVRGRRMAVIGARRCRWIVMRRATSIAAVRRITRAGATGLLAGVLACCGASAARGAPTIAVTESCAYSGAQFAVAGTGFDPGQPVTLEVMSTANPTAGAPSQAAVATPSAAGNLLAIFPVGAGLAAPSVLRSVRARTPGDPAAPASLLATAPLRIASRSVAVSGGDGTAGSTQHWRLTGLPDGARLYAHYRHGGRTVADRFLGSATDPCGRMSFDLRTLPRGFGRRGTWELWMTTQPTFRRPATGIYVRRRLTAAGSRSGSRVSAGATTSRLAPLDPRMTSPVTNGMGADASQIGLITLSAFDIAAPVVFFERVDDRLKRLGTGSPLPGPDHLIGLKDATTWSCDRRDRRFVATGTRPGGGLALATFGVRTPSCASRFDLGTPRRIAVGAVARVRIADRWALGAITPSLCIAGPGKRRACQRVKLAAGIAVARRRFRATGHGRWRVQLRVRGRPVASAVVVAGAGAITKAPPTLLATGDSTMQGLDAFLGDELGDAVTLVSDVRIGSGISRPAAGPGMPGAFSEELARAQTARLRQRTTVVSIGAAEGFDMTTPGQARVVCCDVPWQTEYARRVRSLMQIYARNGRGRVVWLTIPLPRADRRVPSVRAANAAIVAAGAGLPAVKVLRMDSVFTPDGYREVMRYRGRDVAVRDADGVHLSVAGTAIEASIVAQALRGG